MTSPTGDGAQSGTDSAQSGAGTQDPNITTDSTASAGDGAQSGDGNQNETATVSRAEYEALMRRLQAADQNNAKAQAALKAHEDAKLSEQEKMKRDLEEAQKALQEKEAQIRQKEIENAFFTDNTYDWQDPKVALRLADLSAVEIDDKGTVKGLKDALKTVADAHPYLLKPNKGDSGATATGGMTGVSGRSGQSATGGDKAGLEKRFPQLKGRVS